MGFFSIGLAKLVGNRGCVVAVDVQQKMLNELKRRAGKAGVLDRIRIHRCESDKLGVKGPVDFILAFWMLHEVPDTNLFFHQACSCLRPNGKILIAEPKFHVSSKRFREILVSAQKSVLKRCEVLGLRFSRSAVLEKAF